MGLFFLGAARPFGFLVGGGGRVGCRFFSIDEARFS